MYRCAACRANLFSSATKFDSGTGWPSFTEPAVAESIELRQDRSLFMHRTDVVCAVCGGTSDMCSMTVRPGGLATASTPCRWSSTPRRMSPAIPPRELMARVRAAARLNPRAVRRVKRAPQHDLSRREAKGAHQ
jgi:hypothetical protein